MGTAEHGREWEPIDVEDENPAALFKFMSAYRIRATLPEPSDLFRLLRQDQIYVPSPAQFNDPYDCMPDVRTESTAAEQRAAARRGAHRRMPGRPRYEVRRLAHDMRITLNNGRLGSIDADRGAADAVRYILRDLGVLCATTDPLNLLMWGHYASSHTGVCVRFDTRYNPFLNAKRVTYEDERPVLRPLSRDRGRQAAEASLVKARLWSYEREWRATTPGKVGWTDISPLAVTGILLGALISKQDREVVCAMAAARDRPIPVMQAALDLRRYALHVESL